MRLLLPLALACVLTSCRNPFATKAADTATLPSSESVSLDAAWTPQWSSIVALYRLDGTGSLANGSLLPAETGGPGAVTNSGGTTFDYASGKFGQALAFDGSGPHYVDIPRAVQDDFTINFWIKTTESDSYDPTTCVWWGGWGLVNADMSSTQNDFGFNLCGGIIAFGTGNPDVTVRSSVAVNDGQWHMITGTRVRSTGTFTVYVDGVRRQSSSTGGTQSLTAPTAIRLGWQLQSYGNNYYVGLLDEVALWSVALSDAEIQTVFAH